MTRKHWIVVLVLLLVTVAVGTAAAWHFARPRQDPQVAEVLELQKEVFRDRGDRRDQASSESVPATKQEDNEETEERSDEEREKLRQQLRDKMEKLTEEQRRQVFQSFREEFHWRMRERIKEYHALSPKEKVAHLDEQIDRMERYRSRFRNRDFASRGPRGRRRPSGPEADERRQQRRREMLTHTTPQERAEFTAYFNDLNERREERGLEPMRRFGRR